MANKKGQRPTKVGQGPIQTHLFDSTTKSQHPLETRLSVPPPGRHFMPLVTDPTQLLATGMMAVPDSYLPPPHIPNPNDNWRSQAVYRPSPAGAPALGPNVPLQLQTPSLPQGIGPRFPPSPQFLPPGNNTGLYQPQFGTTALPLAQRDYGPPSGPAHHPLMPLVHFPHASSSGNGLQMPTTPWSPDSFPVAYGSPSTLNFPSMAPPSPPQPPQPPPPSSPPPTANHSTSVGNRLVPPISNTKPDSASSQSASACSGKETKDEYCDSEEEQPASSSNQPEAAKDREKKQAERYEEIFGKKYVPNMAWERLEDGQFVCHVTRLVFSTAVQSMHHLSKSSYKAQAAASPLREDPTLIAEIERQCAEEKEKLHSQKFSIIKHRNAMHQELRVEAAKLAKAKRKLEHDLMLAQKKIEKMQSHHERQLEYVKASYQRKLDRLMRELAARDPLTNLQELTEQSDLHQDLQRYCFEPYDWAPPVEDADEDAKEVKEEPAANKDHPWSSLMQGISGVSWIPEKDLLQSDQGDRSKAKADIIVSTTVSRSPIAEFQTYCVEPYDWAPRMDESPTESPRKDPWNLPFSWPEPWPSAETTVEEYVEVKKVQKKDPITEIRDFYFRPYSLTTKANASKGSTPASGTPLSPATPTSRTRRSSVPSRKPDAPAAHRCSSVPPQCSHSQQEPLRGEGDTSRLTTCISALGGKLFLSDRHAKLSVKDWQPIPGLDRRSSTVSGPEDGGRRSRSHSQPVPPMTAATDHSTLTSFGGTTYVPGQRATRSLSLPHPSHFKTAMDRWTPTMKLHTAMKG